MVRFFHRSLLIASAVVAGLAAPAAAQNATGYSIIGASHSRMSPKYLTMDAVMKKLRASTAAKVPPDGRLILLNVNFRSLGDADKMVRLDPAELQVQWDSGGSAPVLGAHISKDFWAMDGGFYTSMRPDKYELFAIVPRTATAIDLAQRQPDGTFKTVKARIPLAAAK